MSLLERPPALSARCAYGADTVSWTVLRTLWGVNRPLWHDWNVCHSVDETDLNLDFGGLNTVYDLDCEACHDVELF